MSKHTLLLATTNKGKLKELEAYLSDMPLSIISLSEFSANVAFKEKGKTFIENARGKSLFYGKAHPGLSLGEDSGLEIDHLNGAPGVLSARFAGPEANDEKNMQKVLGLMKNVPEEKRQARFISTMALSKRGEILLEIKEYAEGLILFDKKGDQGFGYDPIFYYPPLKKTFAELSEEIKNQVSHRGRALKKLKNYLIRYLA